jgi:hypothetical protein
MVEDLIIKRICNQFKNVSIRYEYVGRYREVCIHIMQTIQDENESVIQIYVCRK